MTPASPLLTLQAKARLANSVLKNELQDTLRTKTTQLARTATLDTVLGCMGMANYARSTQLVVWHTQTHTSYSPYEPAQRSEAGYRTERVGDLSVGCAAIVCQSADEGAPHTLYPGPLAAPCRRPVASRPRARGLAVPCRTIS